MYAPLVPRPLSRFFSQSRPLSLKCRRTLWVARDLVWVPSGEMDFISTKFMAAGWLRRLGEQKSYRSGDLPLEVWNYLKSYDRGGRYQPNSSFAFRECINGWVFSGLRLPVTLCGPWNVIYSRFLMKLCCGLWHKGQVHAGLC